jgi:UDP-glucose 4-epimerase
MSSAGYIGIHTAICLLDRGFNITILDSLHNSSSKNVENVRNSILRDEQRLRLVVGDIRDERLLDEVFHSGWYAHIFAASFLILK